MHWRFNNFYFDFFLRTHCHTFLAKMEYIARTWKGKRIVRTEREREREREGGRAGGISLTSNQVSPSNSLFDTRRKNREANHYYFTHLIEFSVINTWPFQSTSPARSRWRSSEHKVFDLSSYRLWLHNLTDCDRSVSFSMRKDRGYIEWKLLGYRLNRPVKFEWPRPWLHWEEPPIAARWSWSSSSARGERRCYKLPNCWLYCRVDRGESPAICLSFIAASIEG